VPVNTEQRAAVLPRPQNTAAGLPSGATAFTLLLAGQAQPLRGGRLDTTPPSTAYLPLPVVPLKSSQEADRAEPRSHYPAGSHYPTGRAVTLLGERLPCWGSGYPAGSHYPAERPQ
jgi:hypothetical protein